MQLLENKNKPKKQIFIDEYHRFSQVESSSFYMLRMLQTMGHLGWSLGEMFNKRYMTVVGGNATYCVFTKEGGTSRQVGTRLSSIFDSKTNTSYSTEEAKQMPELSACLERLYEREVEYKAHLENVAKRNAV